MDSAAVSLSSFKGSHICLIRRNEITSGGKRQDANERDGLESKKAQAISFWERPLQTRIHTQENSYSQLYYCPTRTCTWKLALEEKKDSDGPANKGMRTIS